MSTIEAVVDGAISVMQRQQQQIDELQGLVDEAYEIFRDWDNEDYTVRKHRVSRFMRSVKRSEP